jgi:hypothetical protein
MPRPLGRQLTPLLLVLLIGLALVGLARPAAARANAYTRVAGAYIKSSTGTLSPCAFTSAELETALKQAQTYDVQYGGDITTAIQSALAARANGACRAGSSSGSTTTPAGSLGPGATLKGGGARLPSSTGAAGSGGSGGLPLVLVVIFALAGACLLALGAWVAVSALGLDPRLGRAARHSLREAEYRMSASWDDWSDRLRR